MKDSYDLLIRSSIYESIESERDYQERRWGFRQTDGSFLEPKHSVEEFMIYMEDYLHEARHQISRESGPGNALVTLLKVVTLGIACFEQNGIPEHERTSVINGRDGLPA